VPALSDEFNAEQRIAELERTARNLQRRLAQAKAKTADLVDAVFEGAREAALIVGQPKPVTPPKRDKRTKDAAAGLLHLTDWQLGKETADYSTEVCERRVMQAVAKTIRITEVQRADHPVPVCHVMFGGDHVENVDTYPLQIAETDSTIFEQVFRAASLMQAVVISLLGSFDRVEVWEVAGNHGRIGRRGQYPAGDNFDRIACKIARDQLAAQDRLTWHAPSGWHEIVTIGEYRAALIHGHEIKSFGGGVPHYGIHKAANAWASGVIEPFSDLYLGHMHQVLQMTLSSGQGRVFMTGSTESSSEYARQWVKAAGTPSQRFHEIDPERGRVTGEWVLWLD
jgi:hypothetical protein